MTSTAPLDIVGAIAAELTYLRGGDRNVTNKLLADAAGLSERQVIRLLKGDVAIDVRQLDQFASVLNTEARVIVESAYDRIAASERKPVA